MTDQEKMEIIESIVNAYEKDLIYHATDAVSYITIILRDEPDAQAREFVESLIEEVDA